MLLGAIDVGTNSIHLIVVELDPRFGTSRTILKAREMVRLGGGTALSRGHLSKKAVQRGVGAIAKFAEAARAAGASDVRAVATSAVREASNREEFLAAVRATSGIEVDVLGDTEEARLIHLGVSRGYPLGDRIACIFDIGGGSTEFIVADSDRPFFLHSLRLGSLRLYEEYLRDESALELGFRAMNKHVDALLAPIAHQLSEYRFDVLIGTSGTVMGLAALDAASAGATSQRAHGYVLRLDRLRALQKTMSKLSPLERRKLPGMNPRRSDIIVAGNALVIAILEALGREELVVCERALREGIVIDYLERNIAVARKLGDERTRRFDAAHALARRFDADAAHGNHVGMLALLHDVGRAIASSAHHKHSAYIVRNAVLHGWRAEETELIAALVRYHRKALPKAGHPEWDAASPAMRDKIVGLGGILRLADAVDRRHLGVVNAVRACATAEAVTLTLEAQQDVTPEIEAALFKSDLFVRAFGREVAIEAALPGGYASSFGDSEPSASEIDAASLSG